jgi:putative transposase
LTAAFTALRDEAGLSVKRSCAVTGIARATYYRHARGPAPVELGPRLPRRLPPSALSDEERAQVLALLADPAYVDLAIPQVWARELDADRYWCSLSTMYRIARAAGQVRERRRLASHPPRVRPELVADGPDQVWSWDITALQGPSKGCWYKCYVIMDIYSRYVTGWLVVPSEEGDIAKEFIEDAVRRNGARPHTIHSDRGGPMISKPVSNLLVDLGVTRSHSRPRTSNDNPYSEALFKTVKYVPDFPARFGSIEDARAFCNAFFAAYNHEHRHSGIGLHTPASVHFGTAVHVRAQRQTTLDQAYAAHPERFARRPQAPQLPKQVWINEPQPLEAQPVSV